MTFGWRADNGPTLNAGLVALLFPRGSGPILLRILYLCDFPWGAAYPLSPPPLDPRMAFMFTYAISTNIYYMYAGSFIYRSDLFITSVERGKDPERYWRTTDYSSKSSSAVLSLFSLNAYCTAL